MWIYLNGELVEKEKAVISPFDHGYLYGLGVFETIRTYNGHPFLLEEHVKRLNDGIKQLGIERHWTSGEVEEIIRILSEKNQLLNSYIRFNVSAGVGEIGLQTEPYVEPTTIVFQKPLTITEGLKEKEGVLLELRRNTPETALRLKSHHYLNNIVAKREIGNAPNKEGIFLTEEGFVAEGIVSNIFWVVNDELFTPSLSTGILNGITRKFILKLARLQQMTVHEGCFYIEEIKNAEEVFLTNSIQEIVPVTKIGETIYPGKKGKVVKRLYEFYRNYTDHNG
ncbi:4-amino-4-deoxychorismate lyase [Oikeobacillus pervagus]|uniref:4-amino-4-deoxychorismate lyase n=1 Tax=Oikeobacillus pervagus TaxID=1325931 RepID=A0AAJ1WJQ0_9BACI|nr:aminodeoxychorismate lyase [Oikeobacillus pervagus]MDQ0215895.1 4-amino-4-deoxychorismate lyase [Oikeobacillus pervagus]